MTTPRDICDSALRDIGVVGVGQTARAEDINIAFTRLNWMVSQWNRKRWLLYHLVDVAFVSTGAQSYTVGPGQNFDVAIRPDKLEAAFFRQIIQSQPSQIDYPLQILYAREDYNNIALKQLMSFPSYIFYDSDWPVGTVYPWPVIQSNIYELHLSLKMVLANFTNLSQVINLPGEYDAALHHNLVARLAVVYTKPLSDAMIALAKDALNVLREGNTQIARLVLPQDLLHAGVYNVYSDQVR